MKNYELIVTDDQLEKLNEATKTNDTVIILMKIREIVESNKFGFTALSKKTGMSRESLYKTLSPKKNPSLSTLLRITYALGLKPTLVSKDGRIIIDVLNDLFQPERSKREDHESGCGALNIVEIQ